MRYRILKDESGDLVYEVESDGFELLHNPILNKESAFSSEERRLFQIEGYLPPRVLSLRQQVEKSYENFSDKSSDIERYIFLRSLQDRNETLFYALVMQHLEQMIPIVYTPTVGQACENYSHISRSTRGVFLSPANIDHADEIFAALPYQSIRMIVVTDSEAILGIGDQGVGGMGIPIGKLSLYVAGAGLNPANCLPVTLDVGTDNPALLSDPLYLGMRERRLRGSAYFDLVERFVAAVRRNFPEAILQWEDFSKQNAFTLLERYRGQLPSFNDDIQGTGAVAVAGIYAALRRTGASIAEQRFAVLGAGAGGIGVARQLATALRLAGLSDEEVRRRIFVLDSRGVVFEGRPGGLDAYKEPFAQPADFAHQWDIGDRGVVGLLEAVRFGRATVLVGVSGVPGAFTEPVVRAMADNGDHPIIFPLSNPTVKAEAAPADILRWTEGRATVATGSPFRDVDCEGRTVKIGQGNNVFVFPGVGLGALVVGASQLTDEMFTAAAERLSELVSPDRLDQGCVYPSVQDLRRVTQEVAIAVAQQALQQQVARRPVVAERLEAEVAASMWEPRYARFTRASG